MRLLRDLFKQMELPIIDLVICYFQKPVSLDIVASHLIESDIEMHEKNSQVVNEENSSWV